MTYPYNKKVETFGAAQGRLWPEGTYITPEGDLFDVHSYSRIAHGGGFVIPFFRRYMHPEKLDVIFYTKEEQLENLLEYEKTFSIEEDNVNIKEQKMRLRLVRYLINVYRSKRTVYDYRNDTIHFEETIGIPTVDQNWSGRDFLLKDILVQACGYDAVESQLYRTITTSKFNIYETFYDYILHDYKIFQLPKKIYSEKEERYMDWVQPDWYVPEKELRLKAELEAICRTTPLEEKNIAK